MKKVSRLAVVLIMLAAMVFAAAACKKPSQVLIEQENLPQLIFVQGNDLDLSSGKLTVRYEDEVETIPLNSSGIKITGYDKNQLGVQEITISYKGKTAKLNVTVVPRIQAKGITKNYFVGESFDNNGEIVITEDNGVSFNVKINDSKVSIEGFNSQSEQLNQEITVRYVDNEKNVNYTGTFTVNINSINSIDFYGPTKTAYRNYEELDLKGGYLALKAKPELNADIKYVSLTKDMISGYDPSKVTPEHREQPLAQTITVSYAGRSWTFNVNIRFSDVTIIKPIIEELAVIDWTTGELPEISAELGEQALEAMNLYLNLSEAEQNAFTIQEEARLVRTAAVYGYRVYQQELQSLSNVFVIRDGRIYFTSGSYQQTLAALDRLQDEDDTFYFIGNILAQIHENFPGVIVSGEVSIEDYLSSIFNPLDPKNEFEVVPQILEYMVSLYESLKDVPANWLPQALNQYETQITEAFNLITTSPFRANRVAYDIIASWRQDFFDIIYWHYFLEDDAESVLALKNWYLPSMIEKVYSNMVYAASQGNSAERTMFMWYYTNALKYENELLASNNTMYITLYYYLGFEGFLVDSQGNPIEASLSRIIWAYRTVYSQSLGVQYGIEQYHEYWNDYLEVFEKYLYDPNYIPTSTEYAEDVEDLFTRFAAMSPMAQLGFLQSVNLNYPSRNAFDLSQGYTSYFSMIVINYYGAVLPENAFVVLWKVLNAYEYYIQHLRGYGGNRLDAFNAIMDEAIEDYALLTIEEKEAFNEYVGFFFNKILDVYNNYGDRDNISYTNLGDWAVKFAELDKYLNYTILTLQYMNQQPLYSAFFTAFEAAEALVLDILQNAPENVKLAYFHEPLFYNNQYTLDRIWFEFRSSYMSLLHGLSLSLGGQGYMLLDLYSEDLKEFLALAAYPMWTYFLDYDEDVEKNESIVLEAMAAFRNLNRLDRTLFLIIIDSDTNFYHLSLMQFFSEVLPEGKLLDLAIELIGFEIVYIDYTNNSEGSYPDGPTYLEALKESMANILELKDQLTEGDQAAFDKYIKDMYEYYKDAYDALELEDEEAEEGGSGEQGEN